MPFTPSQLFNKIFYITLFFLLWHLNLAGQEFGGLPPGIDWRQINTDLYRIIFPQTLESNAQRLANTFSMLQNKELEEVGDKSLKIDIVLHNQTTISNGFVGLAPWRSYFYTTPLQNSYGSTSLPWLEYLAIHEYRHVLQFSNSRNGISKILYYLFGEEAWAGAVNVAVPDWYFEGDAVWAETNLTSQGRGVIPSFLTGYRSLWANEVLPGYSAARNGSISDFIPDHYRLGYLMVRYGYKHFGQEFWKKILNEASRYKGLIYPFERSLETHSGISIKDFYRRAVEDYKIEYWEPKNTDKGNAQMVLPRETPDTYTDYLHPAYYKGALLFYKKSYDRTGAFYYLDSEKKEKKILDRGISSNDYYSLGGRWIVWTELYTHPRWIEKDFQEIILYDLETYHKKRVTHGGKFFSPDIDSSGRKIVAVQVDEETFGNLVIIDATTGSIQKVIPNKFEWFFTYPKWSNNGQYIVSSVRNKQGQMGIIRLDPQSGDTEILVPFGRAIIGVPFISGDRVVFSSGSPETENIFILDPDNKDPYQITNSLAGAFQPYVKHDTLYYVEFSYSGYQILNQSVGNIFQLSNGFSKKEDPVDSGSFNTILNEIPEKQYSTEKYAPLAHAFNFHSWGFNFESSNLVLRALSTNILNNIEFAGGLRFEAENDSELLIRPGSVKLNPFARISMAFFYPQLDLEVSTIKRSSRVENRLFEWRETTISSNISIPLNYSSGVFKRTLLPLFGMDQTLARGDIHQNLTSIKAGLFFTQSRIKARKNIFSKNGQFVYLLLKESVDELHARELSVRTGWAFPGIGRNHSTVVNVDYQSEEPDSDYRFGDSFPFPRGSVDLPFDQVLKIGADYHFPLIYPDFGLGGIVYFYRIRGNIFYDWSDIKFDGNRENVSSAGTEFVFDLNLFNTLPLSVGMRYSRIFNQPGRTNHISFFIPISRF